MTLLMPISLNSLADHPLFIDSAVGKSLRMTPLGFIDVGARGGAHDIVDPLAKLTAVLGFEPDQAECARLLSLPAVYEPWAAFHLEPVALADKKAAAELVLLSAATNHSLLPPNTEFTQRYNMEKWQEIGRESLRTELLDTVLFSQQLNQYSWGEFIKLDTQGTEYEILQGATRMLNERTVAIVTEVAFCELYKGQKLFSEIELMLREYGFSFYGFTKLHGRSCKLLDKQTHMTVERAFYADAVFFKDPLPGAPQRKKVSDRGIYVLFSAALLLGYYDFALELASKTWINNEKELLVIKALISQFATHAPDDTHLAVTALVKRVDEQPALANVIVGGFVDQRRRVCNYDDVLNVNVLPKTL
ncbi:MAG TPA: FkbM family methyltransferase [Gammaproteobacteria bacterium]|jgi:FkbM family methyltransferase|nr:FkbM family methyltransferase [Gammaproteobacteria bacterium]